MPTPAENERKQIELLEQVVDALKQLDATLKRLIPRGR